MARECILCRFLRGLTPQRCAAWLVGLALLCTLPLAFGADPLRLAFAPAVRLAQAGGNSAGTGTPRLPDLPGTPAPVASAPASTPAPAASPARPASAPAAPAVRPAARKAAPATATATAVRDQEWETF